MSVAINKIKEIIDTNQLKNEKFTHFVLQGGAGSGKTESLKEIISFISEKYPKKTIACITHTNVAADEIANRINNNKHHISTIHSFLNELIKNFKKNLQEILPIIFCLKNDDIADHSDYKKRHEKLGRKKYELKNELIDKVIGKKEYDKNPNEYNALLLKEIDSLNLVINERIKAKNYNDIRYNETKFDSLEDVAFSHDSLLKLSNALCEKFILLPKIISDKFDYIFIDEYQDTNPVIIKLFLEFLPPNMNTTIGLFGDSMQGIYDDGVGDVESYIDKGVLRKIDKDDNYRCSEQVIKFINTLRNDTIQQELALKVGETKENRQGFVKLFIKTYAMKPSSRSTEEEKNLYFLELNKSASVIRKILNLDSLKVLLLTNKSISKELGFELLYNIFNDRFTDVKDEIEKELARIQVIDVLELLNLFKKGKHNELLLKCKKNGFLIKSLNDKNKLIEFLTYLLDSELSLQKALEYALEIGLIKESERANNYKKSKEYFLKEFDENIVFKELEAYYLSGFNTLIRVNKEYNKNYNQPEFDDFLYALKKKSFFQKLFSEGMKFKEVVKYFEYLNEEADYITMHKTKGSGIRNVLVVLDEYLWSKYDFKSIYSTAEQSTFNQKLFYVSCSRAIENLVIMRFVEDKSEEMALKSYFKNCDIVDL